MPLMRAYSFIFSWSFMAPSQVYDLSLQRWFVTWPEGCKDANDVLIRNGGAALAACIDQVES